MTAAVTTAYRSCDQTDLTTVCEITIAVNKYITLAVSCYICILESNIHL